MLFTERSLWTMVHGVVLGGAALMALAAALFAMGVMRVADPSDVATDRQSRSLARLTVFIAVVLRDAQLRNMAMIMLAVSLALVSFVGLMGIFVAKVAPLR